MNFTAIDFETAHAEFPCEIGLTRVENGIIINTKSWLIKPACFPYMNYWNQKVHGISSSDLASSPTFEDLWSELKPWFEDNYLVAHNAAFDMRVLRAALNYYDLAVPYSEYFSCRTRKPGLARGKKPVQAFASAFSGHQTSYHRQNYGQSA